MLRRNVLIFQTGGLGDFVLTWPFAVALARIYPQSRVIYVTNQQKGELARRVLRLEATDIELGWHGLFADGGKLPPAAASMLASAHSVYSFLPTSAVWKQNVEQLSPGVRQIELNSRLPENFTGHVTQLMIDSLQTFPPERAALEQLLRSISDRGIGFKPAGGGDVVIHPGSSSRDKCWALDRFVSLADRLKNMGRNVVFITGETERDRWSERDFKRLTDVARHRSCDTLLDFLDEISKAGQFIGNDSGPGHLAGIIGIPTLSLFGVTNSANWKPLGPRVTVIEVGSFDALLVEDVLKLM